MFETGLDRLEQKAQAIKRLNNLKTEVGRLPDGNAKAQLLEELRTQADALVEETAVTRTQSHDQKLKSIEEEYGIGSKEYILETYRYWSTVTKPAKDKAEADRKRRVKGNKVSHGGTRAS